MSEMGMMEQAVRKWGGDVFHGHEPEAWADLRMQARNIDAQMAHIAAEAEAWRALAVELGEALRGYERWEATVIMDGACWPWDAPMALTRERYDEMIALQRPRNAVLRRLQERQEAGR